MIFKFFKLLAFSVTLPILFGLFIKYEGKGRRHLQRQHPVLSTSHFLITKGGALPDQNYSQASLQTAVDKIPGIAFYLPIYITKDNHFLVSTEELAKFNTKKEHSVFYNQELQNWQDQQTKHKLLTLEKALQSFPTTKIIIDIKDNVASVNQSLIPIIEKHQASKRCIFYSRYGNIIRNLKELKPHWLLSVPGSDLPKVYLMSQLFLQEAAPIYFPITFFKTENSFSYFNQRIANEILRRKQHFLFEGSLDKIPNRKKLSPAFLAFMSNNFSTLLKLSDAHFNN